MKVQGILIALFSLGLLAGCVKTDPAPATGTPTSGLSAAPTASSPSAATSSPAASATPNVLQAAYSLDIATLTELPEGVSKVADQKGRAEQALAFSGELTKVEVPWNINAEKHPQLTITAWGRFTGNIEDRAQFQVVSCDDGGYDRGVGLDARAGEWGWSAFAGEGEVMGGIPVQPNEWTFLAVTYDQAQNRSQLTVGETAVEAKKGALGTAHPFVWIGGNPSFGEHFIGDIAHVQIFNRVLTPEELKSVRDQ